MKTVLITGGSRGIGLACAEEFQRDHRVITVARKGDVSIHGDVADARFREQLLAEVDPDIFINNAGLSGYETSDFRKIMEVNFLAAGELLLGFYRKMRAGNIINIASVVANHPGYAGMNYADVIYFSSKAAIKRLSEITSESSRTQVKVTSIEPGAVNTDFANIRNRAKSSTPVPSDYLHRYKIKPIDPKHVAKTVRWVVEQPEEISIGSIELRNVKTLPDAQS